MITKHRNRGILQLIIALLMTATCFFAVTKLIHQMGDLGIVLFFLSYMATVTMWLVGSFSLAKAKGYSSDMMGSVLIFLYVLGICVPMAPLVIPAVVIFGLKDKTRGRSSMYRG